MKGCRVNIEDHYRLQSGIFIIIGNRILSELSENKPNNHMTLNASGKMQITYRHNKIHYLSPIRPEKFPIRGNYTSGSARLGLTWQKIFALQQNRQFYKNYILHFNKKDKFNICIDHHTLVLDGMSIEGEGAMLQ